MSAALSTRRPGPTPLVVSNGLGWSFLLAPVLAGALLLTLSPCLALPAPSPALAAAMA